MKNLALIITSAFILVACNNYKDKEISVDFIKGKWKNCSATNSIVVFNESGDYDVFINGEKVDAAKLKYSLSPSDKKYNIKIFENSGLGKTVNNGFIEIIDNDKFKMTIYYKDYFQSSSEFTRL